MRAIASQHLKFSLLYWSLMGNVILMNYIFVELGIPGRLFPIRTVQPARILDHLHLLHH